MRLTAHPDVVPVNGRNRSLAKRAANRNEHLEALLESQSAVQSVSVMGTLKATTEKAIGKLKQVVAEIVAGGKLRDEVEVDNTRSDSENGGRSGGYKPLGNLDRLT